MIRAASIFSAYIVALLLMATAYAVIPSGAAVAITPPSQTLQAN